MGIDIKIWNRSEVIFSKADALFDTGAHTCAIDTNVALRLGYVLDDSKMSVISTATGEKRKTFQIFIDKLIFGEFKFGPVLMNVFDFPIISHSIVIGVNVIKNFDVNLRLHENLITISPVFEYDEYNSSTEMFGDWRINSNE